MFCRSRRRLVRGAAGALAVLTLAGGALAVLREGVARRHAAYDLEWATTEAVFAQEERAGPLEWAPRLWQRANSAQRAARLAHARALGARWWWPDFSAAIVDLQEAARTARQAANAGRRRRAEARRAAVTAVQETTLVVSRADSVSAVGDLGVEHRRHRARARLLLDQAGAYLRAGDPLAALDRASRAQEAASEVVSRAETLWGRFGHEVEVRMWRQWEAQAIARSQRAGGTAIVISKADRDLTVYVGGRAVLAIDDLDLSFNWAAKKLYAGDVAVPEGHYRVSRKKSAGDTLYYKALLLDYPNAADRAAFREAQRTRLLPSSARIGGLIEIHGEGGRGVDWTRGCIAVTNPEMDLLYERVQVGTPVVIIGARAVRLVDELIARRRNGLPDEGGAIRP